MPTNWIGFVGNAAADFATAVLQGKPAGTGSQQSRRLAC
jgi:hypothetical protein